MRWVGSLGGSDKMLDVIGPNGYNITTDGTAFNVKSLTGVVILSYHPNYGESVLGYLTPITIVNAREDLEYAKRLFVSGSDHTV